MHAIETCRTPALGGQDAAGDEAVEMEMGTQLLIPRVQHHGDTECAAEVVASELQQRLGGALKE